MSAGNPVWKEEGLLNTESREFLFQKQKLEALAAGIRVFARSGGDPLALAKSVDQARDLARSLLTACEATRSLFETNATVARTRNEVLSLYEKIDEAGEKALKQLRELPAGDPRLEDPVCRAWLFSFEGAGHETVYEQRKKRGRRPPTEQVRRVLEPLTSLYGHLKTGVHVSVEDPQSGTVRQMNFSAADSFIKNTDDSLLRRRTYCAVNAWFAENGAPFADLLNAIVGYRLNEIEYSGLTREAWVLKPERLSHEAFRAMMDAVRRAVPAVHRAMRIRSKIFAERDVPGFRMGGGNDCTMPPCFFEAAYPDRRIPKVLRSFAGAEGVFERALSEFYPDGCRILGEEIAGGWIESRKLSGGRSGSWSEAVPAENAVAVYADYSPTVARGYEFAHSMGEAFLKKELLSLPMPLRDSPFTVCEIAGRFMSQIFQSRLIGETEGSDEMAPVLWHALRRLSVNMLYLPFRYELAKNIMEARGRGVLSVPDLKRLTREAWDVYFGDTTTDPMQFVWAYKVHFYQPSFPHYDFQYTLGFLAAHQLERVLKENGGRTACGGTFGGMLRDSAVMTVDGLLAKHLGADIRKPEFWTEAVERALEPVRTAEKHMSVFSRF